jgi:hypothetical protein
MFQFSAAVSIIIGGFIAVYSFQIVLWLSVIPQIICIYISLKIVDPPKKYEQSTNIYQHLSSAFSLIWINKELKISEDNYYVLVYNPTNKNIKIKNLENLFCLKLFWK